MISEIVTQSYETHVNDKPIREYAEKLVLSLGHIEAICTAMDFKMFSVAEELRFMQDEYRGV
ncbi:MAG: hypothetical protein HWE34_06645 [Methylocystaceae bacterium]|jgi:hypothetical protein|nr:hypothetical protein [Methylocystaceae bacterium]